jgi:uncharacterized protein (DUF427 family)
MARAIWNETVLAESGTFELLEGNVYFPPDSVQWNYLKPGDRQYTCPWKGKAVYYDIVIGDKVKNNAAWNYPEPKEAAQYIKNYVAFEIGNFGSGVKLEK